MPTCVAVRTLSASSRSTNSRRCVVLPNNVALARPPLPPLLLLPLLISHSAARQTVNSAPEQNEKERNAARNKQNHLPNRTAAACSQASCNGPERGADKYPARANSA